MKLSTRYFLKYHSVVRILSRLRYLLRSKTSGSALLRWTRRQADERSRNPLVVSLSNHTAGKFQKKSIIAMIFILPLYAANPPKFTRITASNNLDRNGLYSPESMAKDYIETARTIAANAGLRLLSVPLSPNP